MTFSKLCKYCNYILPNNHRGFICSVCKNGIGRYNLNRNEQINLLKCQNNKCALCENDIKLHTGKNYDACIDHDHKTGKVRGVLCGYCNTSLGRLDCIDRKKFVSNLNKYLKS